MSSQWSLKAPKHRISVAKNKVHSYSIGYNNIIQLSSVLRNVKGTNGKFSILPAFLSDHLKQTSDSRERDLENFLAQQNYLRPQPTRVKHDTETMEEENCKSHGRSQMQSQEIMLTSSGK